MALALVLALGVLRSIQAEPELQVGPTATPASIDLQNAVPQAQQLNATLTPTRTPTPVGPVQIEAIENANVRAIPDTAGDLLGQIRPGEFYNVIRQYYSWIEFQYDPAPSRRGWVFGELVNIIGDPNSIVQVTSLDEPAEGVPDVAATVTGAALTQTPGGLLTATFLARSSPVPPIGIIPGSTAQGPATLEVGNQQALPTYTFPPGMIALAPTEAPSAVTQTPEMAPLSIPAGDSIPPIAPIVGLAALALLGFIISSIRR